MITIVWSWSNYAGSIRVNEIVGLTRPKLKATPNNEQGAMSGVPQDGLLKAYENGHDLANLSENYRAHVLGSAFNDLHLVDGSYEMALC
jgi:hypothetical protein